jgi:DNA invertase Pin-like site-specific DNA recombinase
VETAGRLLGYARVSDDAQSSDLQRDALLTAGVPESLLFVDDGISGAVRERPALDALLKEAKDGDVVVVWRLDRLGRSSVHLSQVAETLRERGVWIRGLSDGIDTRTAEGRMIYGVISSIAVYEREIIRSRVKSGMAAAKRRGVHVGRRRALSAEKIAHATRLRLEGKTDAEIAHLFDVDRSTVWRALKGIAMGPAAVQEASQGEAP